jgi:predicted acyltransferase
MTVSPHIPAPLLRYMIPRFLRPKPKSERTSSMLKHYASAGRGVLQVSSALGFCFGRPNHKRLRTSSSVGVLALAGGLRHAPRALGPVGRLG